jgi:hypothetical protein
MCLWRLGQSLTGVVTSMDTTDPISLCRLRLPRLVLSRSVRFTNRFTEQPIDLQFPAPLRALPSLPSLGAAACPDSPSDRQRRGLNTRRVAPGRATRLTVGEPVGGTVRSEWEWLRREAQDFEETVAAGAVVPGVRGPPRGSGRAAGGCDGHRHGSGCLARHGAADPPTAWACSYVTRTGTTSWRAAYVWSRGLSACPDLHQRGAVPAWGRRPSECWSAGQLVTTPLGDATFGRAPFFLV